MMTMIKLFRGVQALSSQVLALPRKNLPAIGYTGSLSGLLARTLISGPKQTPLLSQAIQSQTQLPGPVKCKTWNTQPVRTKVYFSRRTGRPRTVNAAVQRFFRLHNGQWIRTQAGRTKKKWAKTQRRINRLQQHLICNQSQSRLLDRMVGPHYKKPRHYPDDPYAAYHKFDNIPHYNVLGKKPRFLP